VASHDVSTVYAITPRCRKAIGWASMNALRRTRERMVLPTQHRHRGQRVLRALQSEWRWARLHLQECRSS
jgi:hypothetical protein